MHLTAPRVLAIALPRRGHAHHGAPLPHHTVSPTPFPPPCLPAHFASLVRARQRARHSPHRSCLLANTYVACDARQGGLDELWSGALLSAPSEPSALPHLVAAVPVRAGGLNPRNTANGYGSPPSKRAHHVVPCLQTLDEWSTKHGTKEHSCTSFWSEHKKKNARRQYNAGVAIECHKDRGQRAACGPAQYKCRAQGILGTFPQHALPELSALPQRDRALLCIFLRRCSCSDRCRPHGAHSCLPCARQS